MMIQFTLDSAKLHYCYSNVIGAAFSAPVLLCHPGTPLLFVCCLVCLSGSALVWSSFAVLRLCWDLSALLCLCYLPLPSLRYERMELRVECTSIVYLFD